MPNSSTIPHHFPPPDPAASLLLSHRPPTGKVALILGTGKLAASRCFACLEAGIRPIVVAVQRQGAQHGAKDPLSSDKVCDEIRYRVEQNQVGYKVVRYDAVATAQEEATRHTWSQLLDKMDEGEANSIFIVCITDTLHSGDVAQQQGPRIADDGSAAPPNQTAYERAAIVSKLCRQRRIPINVADKPDLCDFSFPASHRFPCIEPTLAKSSAQATGSSSSPLQIAVTTNGRGCRLAGRIRRELVGALPRNVGDAVEKVGRMRDMAKQEDQDHSSPHAGDSTGSPASAPAQPSAQKPKTRRPIRERTASGTGYKNVEEEDLSFDTTPLNSPVPQLTPKNPMDRAASSLRAALNTSAAAAKRHVLSEREREEAVERTKRRMRWVAQISEYWPIEYLGGLRWEQMQGVLSTYAGEQPAADASAAPSLNTPVEAVEASAADGSTTASDDINGTRAATVESGTDAEARATDRGRGISRTSSPERHSRARSQHSLVIRPPLPLRQKRGHIYLLGSGPGHPGLLTVLAHRLLSSPQTHLILSDKLVPSSILRLIPSSTPLEIAKKFPGNAEGAQSELIAMALRAALEEGKNVVRLKQGDPFVYGRGGEEVLAFRRAGIECTVVPGISSALAAPLMLGIPVTQRGAADSLVLCTGVGRGGKKVRLPGYERGRTVVVLMGVARLKAVVQTLTGNSSLGLSTSAPTEAEEESSIGERDGSPFPPHTPIAIIERASSPDQRMVASTLASIVEALERSGEQRPPGMMVIGWAVLSLAGEGDVAISDDAVESTETTGSQSEAEEELQKRDKSRIDRWLNGKTYVLREGLDEAYRKALHELVPSSTTEPSSSTDANDNARIGWTTRTETGWAGPRYVDGKPQGGWAHGETANVPASDDVAYAQDREYAEIRARLAQMDA